MKHIIHPEADAEFAEAVNYYAKISPELGVRFYREIESLINAVCSDPKRFYQFSPPARRALSQKFPYCVVYFQDGDRIWIIAVMNAKRRPGYWRQRLG